MTKQRPNLSVCIILKNEESNIVSLLDSIQNLPCELVVVDTGSTDRTVAICRDRGIPVVEWMWQDDFSAARNVSLDHATGRWILWLDADDRLSEDALLQIAGLSTKTPDKGFMFLIKNASRDGGDAGAHPQLRMFPNDPRLRFSGRVHEQIAPALVASGFALEMTSIQIRHTGYTDATLLDQKAARNLKLLEIQQKEDRLDPPGWYYLGTSLLRNEDFARAAAALTECLKQLEPDSDQILRAVAPANLSIAIEKTGGKEDALKALLRYAPKDLKQWHAMQILRAGELVAKLGDADRALEYLEKAFDPVLVRPFRLQVDNKGVCTKVLTNIADFWKPRNKSVAVAVLRMLRDILKNHEFSRSALPDIYFEYGLYDRALELYSWCVAVDPDDKGGWAGLITTLRLQGDNTAEEYFDLAFQYFSDRCQSKVN